MYNFIQNGHLSQLNDAQIEAVTLTDGPLLVLAGAGTGKTKVLTTRIYHIITSGIANSHNILAVTFTNKAANEMKTRLNSMFAEESIPTPMWIGTFHSIAAKILRDHTELVGLRKDFTIINADDQLKLINQIFKDFNINTEDLPPKLFLFLLEKAKNNSHKPHNVPASDNKILQGNTCFSDLYAEYQRRLLYSNAVDFSDLIMHNITIFNHNPEICEMYHNKFRYILVDEYQDTNISQYLWLRILAQKHSNICCVGDDDQSIYGWRGAVVENILRFDRDYKNAKVIRLERNYRSTSNILNMATSLIAHNTERHGKTLWTQASDGEPVNVTGFNNDKEEANWLAYQVENLLDENYVKADIAILTRAGHQTRVFEESLSRRRIPYRVVGSIKFYERLEIRDALAYARILCNKDDNLALERALSTPKRGIGPTILKSIQDFAMSRNISMFDAIEVMTGISQSSFALGEMDYAIKGKAGNVLRDFVSKIKSLHHLLQTENHSLVLEMALKESGYFSMWENEQTPESKERLENIKELLTNLQDYTDIREYLENISLISDVESSGTEDKVSIMTMHAAKGLEFDVVFLVGWEEGIFPSQKSLKENGKKALEEERRLAYVGMTRAKKKLYITYASYRKMYGSHYQYNKPSRFIAEILPPNY